VYTSKYNHSFGLAEGSSVLYNTLSGAIDVSDTPDLLSGYAFQDDGSRDLREYLLARGYLFQSADDEASEFERVHRSYCDFVETTRPLIFYLVVTYNCNLKCSYCFQKPVKDKKGTFRLEDVEPAFEAMRSIRSLFPGTRTKPVVALFGGEPLLRANLPLITHIAERIAGEGFLFGPIISNGVDLDAFLPLFARIRPSGIQVTLDGPREVHDTRRIDHAGGGTFDVIVRNVDRALDLGLKLGIRTNLDYQNIDALGDLVAFAEKRGWVGSKQVELNLSPVHDRSCGSLEQGGFHGEMLSRVLAMMQEVPPLRHWHLDGWTVVNYFRRLLDEDRVVLPRFHHCEAAIGKSFHLDMCGKFYTCIEACGMEEYASGEYLPRLRFYPLYEQLRSRSVVNIERCQTCNIALLCGGGCALQSIYDRNSLAAPVCGSIQRDLAAYVRFRFQEPVDTP